MLDNIGFDLWADGYDKSVGLSDDSDTYPFSGYKKVLNLIYNKILEHSGCTVLDLGFGTGTLTKKLYEHSCIIFGQDFSSKMIEKAQAKMPKAHFYCGDFSNGVVSELRKNKYDAIIATYSLHHLTDTDKVSFIKSLMPLLTPNGRIYIGDVAFNTRSELEKCRQVAGNDWDEDEIYFVYEEIKTQFPESIFYPCSKCAGVIELW